MGNFRKGQFKSNDICTKTGEIRTKSLKTIYLTRRKTISICFVHFLYNYHYSKFKKRREEEIRETQVEFMIQIAPNKHRPLFDIANETYYFI